MREPVPQELADSIVKAEDGSDVRLGDLWAQRPILLAFVRHFGCLFCREHVAQLRKQLHRIHATGAELVVVGAGEPRWIPGFRETTHYQGPVYGDPSLGSYRAAKLRYGRKTTYTIRSGAYALRALARGHIQTNRQGDALQQGGVLIILPPGVITYWHISEVAGDNAPVDEILTALERSLPAVAAHA